MTTASETLTSLIVSDAHGIEVVQVARNAWGCKDCDGKVHCLDECCDDESCHAFEMAVGLDPGSLGMILDVILSFIMSLIDKLREGGICVKTETITDEGGNEHIVAGGPLSEKELSDRTIAVLRAPTRLQRARTLTDMKRDLRGVPEADPRETMYSAYRVGGATDNEQTVRDTVHEQGAPDFGYV